MKRTIVIFAALLLLPAAAAQSAPQPPPSYATDSPSGGWDYTPLAVIGGVLVGGAVGTIVGWELVPVFAGVDPELAFGTGAAAVAPVASGVAAAATQTVVIAQAVGAVVGGYLGAVLYRDSAAKP